MRRFEIIAIVDLALLAALLSIPASLSAQAGSQSDPPLRWYKGNTHTHTLNSDGDSTPDDVVRWYREHDYDFLVLTDHNFLTSVDGLNALHGADQQFLVIKGEEVTDRFGEKPLHINGLDISRLVPPQGGTSVVDVVQRNVDAINSANGLSSINHPNYGWAITADELGQVRNNRFFEVFNGHPTVNNIGGGGVPGLEEVWDVILTKGTLLYGIAVDDAHTFKQPGNPDVPGPGRGWIVVRAPKLEGRALLDAMQRGDFYASTGVELTDYRATSQQVTLSVKQRADVKYRVQFVGKGGRLLSELTDINAAYTIRGDEGYVRAKVIESNSRYAWTQPVQIASRPSARADASALLSITFLTLVAGVWRWRSRPSRRS